ncbi:MAG TPA: sulfatase-like hydrolase/transferase [Bryocella sp.]|nr:sulfatase-like hydrolase/transferase [Bryocella sp.]
MDEADHFDSFVARESVRFLEDYARTDEPFFLVTSFLKPHDPFMPAKRFADMYRAEDMQLSPTWRSADLAHLPAEVRHFIQTAPYTPELIEASHARERMAFYYANLAQMDDCAGQVLSALKRLGLDRNTIVLYTSDHGEMLGDLGLWNKFQFYEGSCGVPLLARLPGASPALCEQPVSLISLKQTLAELCDLPDLGGSDGASFASLIRNPSSARQDAPVFAEFNTGKPRAKYMIRRGDYKYTHWVRDIDELYNLREDPQETRNLASDPAHRATVERLRSDLLAWHRPTEA